jgi:cystathionine gamma-lyase
LSEKQQSGFGTRAIHAGQEPDPTTGAIMTPIYQTSTYVQEEPAKTKGYDYSRTINPTRVALEQNLAALEGARHGLCFSSGMGAINCVANLLQKGDHVIACNDLYGGTYRLFQTVYRQVRGRVQLRRHERPQRRRRGLRGKTTRLRAPRNADQPAAAPLRHRGPQQARAREGRLPRRWSTTRSRRPICRTPSQLGADLVVHSTTKYLGGHSATSWAARSSRMTPSSPRSSRTSRTPCGSTPGPQDCFLVLRGTKTLHVRMDRHCDNAEAIAKHLEAAPPASSASTTRALEFAPAARPREEADAHRFGGMMSLELVGGVRGRQARRDGDVQLFALAEIPRRRREPRRPPRDDDARRHPQGRARSPPASATA